MSFLTSLRKSKHLSERTLAEQIGLARETLRSAEQDFKAAKPRHLESIADALNRKVLVAIIPQDPAFSDASTVAVSLAVIADGFDTWKIHFMNLIDQFRRDSDLRLVLLPPSSRLDRRLKALMAAIVSTLCDEVGLAPPEWAEAEYFLDKPWFVSGMESLKASALIESPLAFRRHNIFVQENFMKRA